MSDDHEQDDLWATVTLRFSGDSTDETTLEELGAAIGLRSQATGVEFQRDATDSMIVVYAAPRHASRTASVAQALVDSFGLQARLSVEHHRSQAWRDEWKKFYRPLVFGNGRLLVRPSWIARVEGQPTTEIILDPGRAFGTGLHESTQCCLDWLCELAAEKRTDVSIVDLGCGSGILSIAAARLLAAKAPIWAFDCDPEAVATSRENIEINGLADLIRAETVAADAPLSGHVNAFDLVIANIRPEVLIRLAPNLSTATTASGELVLSGILAEEASEVEKAYCASGWLLAAPPKQRNDWVALRMQRGHPT